MAVQDGRSRYSKIALEWEDMRRMRERSRQLQKKSRCCNRGQIFWLESIRPGRAASDVRRSKTNKSEIAIIPLAEGNAERTSGSSYGPKQLSERHDTPMSPANAYQHDGYFH